MIELPTIKPEWRTSTVVSLCQGMREEQDFSALPILADALQDAGCPEAGEMSKALAIMRHATLKYTEAVTLVACVLSDEGGDAVRWLVDFANGHDCLHYSTLLAAASGHHEENDEGDGYQYSRIAEWDGDYLHFNGSDAHGAIPDEFWERVELVCGKVIQSKPSSFSCSC